MTDNEDFHGITGLIVMVINDAIRLYERPQGITDRLIAGLAQNVAMRIVQNMHSRNSCENRQ